MLHTPTFCVNLWQYLKRTGFINNHKKTALIVAPRKDVTLSTILITMYCRSYTITTLAKLLASAAESIRINYSSLLDGVIFVLQFILLIAM